MIALIAGLAVIAAAGIGAGLWLARQPKRTAAAGAANSHRGGAAAGAVFVCSACGHRHDAEQIRRAMYLGQRTLGDVHAARRGRLGRRLVRRAVSKRLMRAIFN